MTRYRRHAEIPGWHQDALTAATAVVIGVGALGTETARLLAQAGVGRLVLCDPDDVDESNLSRGALFTPADVGRPKAEAAAAALTALVPGIRAEARRAELSAGVGLAELRSAGVVLSCLDSIAARVSLSRRCNLVGAGLLDAGTHPWGGEVRHHVPGGACFGCGLTPAERETADDRWSCARPVTSASHGASAPVSALTAAWLTTTALRVLFGHSEPAGRTRIEPLSGTAYRTPAERDPDCPLHERIAPESVSRTPVAAGGRVGELLDLVAPDEIALSWNPFGRPVPTTVRLRDAAPDATLASLRVAPRELIPVVVPGDPARTRYLELAAEGEGNR